jgi:hypothetical protein
LLAGLDSHARGLGKTNAGSDPAEVSKRSLRTVADPRRVIAGPLR